MDFYEEDDDIIRSSRSKMFFKKDVLKNFGIFTEKRPVLESPFNKVAGIKASYTDLKNSYTGVFL